DAGDGVLLGRAEDRRGRAVRPFPDRTAGRALGRMAADHRFSVGCLDDSWRRRRDRANQYQAAHGLQLDRPCRICADRPRRSVVGAFYYLRVVKVMYFDEPIGAFDRPIAAELKWVLVVTVALTMFFILFPDPIVGGAEAAAKSLFAR